MLSTLVAVYTRALLSKAPQGRGAHIYCLYVPLAEIILAPSIYGQSLYLFLFLFYFTYHAAIFVFIQCCKYSSLFS